MSQSDASPNPLGVQELLDLCIDGIADRTRDLLACSVVAHRWRESAQSHLFRVPHKRYRNHTARAGSSTILTSLLAAFTSNSSLLHHVRELYLVMFDPEYEYRHGRVHESTLNAICQLPFTCLECLTFETWWSLPDTFPLVLGLPSLRNLRLLDYTQESSIFMHSWKHCGPGITHLELSCSKVLNEASYAAFSAAAERRIPLESVRFTLAGSSQIIHSAMFAPLDLSRVKALSINGNHGNLSLPWNKIGLSASLQVLQINYWQFYENPFDFSLFPHLSILFIIISFSSQVISNLSASLSTLASSNPSSIRTIILSQYTSGIPDSSAFHTLDSALCSCATSSLHPDFCVRFETPWHTSKDEVERMFPGVAGRGKLRFVEQLWPMAWHGTNASGLWWRSVVGSL